MVAAVLTCLIASHGLRRKLALCASFLSAIAPSTVFGDSSSAEVPERVRRRLAHVVPFGATLSIEEGDTVFVELTEKIPAIRITRKLSEYEGLIRGASAPKGVIVHGRADESKVEPSGGQVRVLFRYAVHVEPGAPAKGGLVRLTLSLVEQKGLANVVFQKKVTHRIKVVRPKPKVDDLAADFQGYRIYKRLALAQLEALQRSGLKGLTIADQGKFPALDRAGDEVMALALEFDRHRRRIWIAQRHLEAASRLKDPKIAGPAKAYLTSLDKHDADLSGIALVALESSRGETSSPGTERSARTAEIETLRPERVEAAEPRTEQQDARTESTLAPVTTYEPGTEGDEGPDTPPDDAPGSTAADTPSRSKEAPGRKVAVADDELPDAGRLDDDPLARKRGRETVIRSYARGLVLDDPNIAHAVSVRASYARLTGVRGAAGVAPAVFFQGQVAVTRSLGVELVIPTSYVNVNVERAQSLYVIGNPLIGAKYRLHLPAIEERPPALTIRARWAVPISPLHTIPPTQLGAEEFSFPAHFTDTYAFLLEKSDLGIGASAAWQAGMFALGAQVYADYFFPVANALDQTRFLTMSYGASFGVLPFGEIIGAYIEARATSLFAGPRRTELTSYAGARGRFLSWMETALWIALPLGSISEVSGLQVGGELRFSYDVEDTGSGTRPTRQDPLLFE